MYAPNLLTCCAPTAMMLMLLLALSGTAAGQQCGPAPLFDAFGTSDCGHLIDYQANFCGCIGSSMSSIPDCIDDAQPTCSTLKSCAYNYVESVTDLGSRSVTLDSSCANATLAMFHAALALYILPNPVNTPLQQQCYNTVCGMGSDSCKVNTTACSTSALYYPHGYWNLAVLVYVTVKNIRVNRTAVTYDTLLSLFSALEQDVAAAWSLPPQQAFMVRALDVALPSTTALSTVTLEFGLDFETPGGRGLYYRVRHLPTIYLPLTTAVLNTLPVGAGSSRNAFTTATWPITASYGEFDDPTSTVPLPATPELQCFTDYDIDYRIARSVFSSMPECVILGLVLPALSVLFVVVFMTIVKCGSTADELVKAHRARVACETCRVMNVAAYVLVTIRGMSTGVTDSLGICYDTNDGDSLSSSCVNWQMSFSTLAVVSPIIVVVVVLPVLLGATCHARVVAPQLHASCGRRVLRWVLVGLGPIVTMVISPGYIAIQSRLVAKGNCVVSPVVLQEAPLSLGFVILWCLCLVMAGFVMVIDGGSLCSQTACGRGAVNAMFILLAGHALLTGIFGLAVSGAWMGFLQRTGWAVYATTVIPSIVVSLVNDILFLVLFRRPMWRIEPVVDNQVAPGSAFQPATATAVPPPVATSAAVPSAVPVVDVAVALPPPPPPPPMLPTPYDTAAPSEDVEMAAR